MRFSTVICFTAAAAGVLAAPVAQPQTTEVLPAETGTATAGATAAVVTDTVGIASTNNKCSERDQRNGRCTTTTTTKSKTTTTTTTTTKTTTTTTTTTTAVPKPTGPPACKNGRLTFNMKAQSLETYGPNQLPSRAIGQFIVDVDDAATFSDTILSVKDEYYIDPANMFLTETATGKIATVKTSGENGGGKPHVGNIMWLTAADSIGRNFSPLRCSGERTGGLGCYAKDGNRNFAQVCGKFIDFEAQRNNNCQDHILFQVVPTCQL